MGSSKRARDASASRSPPRKKSEKDKSSKEKRKDKSKDKGKDRDRDRDRDREKERHEAPAADPEREQKREGQPPEEQPVAEPAKEVAQEQAEEGRKGDGEGPAAKPDGGAGPSAAAAPSRSPSRSPSPSPKKDKAKPAKVKEKEKEKDSRRDKEKALTRRDEDRDRDRDRTRDRDRDYKDRDRDREREDYRSRDRDRDREYRDRDRDRDRSRDRDRDRDRDYRGSRGEYRDRGYDRQASRDYRDRDRDRDRDYRDRDRDREHRSRGGSRRRSPSHSRSPSRSRSRSRGRRHASKSRSRSRSRSPSSSSTTSSRSRSPSRERRSRSRSRSRGRGGSRERDRDAGRDRDRRRPDEARAARDEDEEDERAAAAAAGGEDDGLLSEEALQRKRSELEARLVAEELERRIAAFVEERVAAVLGSEAVQKELQSRLERERRAIEEQVERELVAERERAAREEEARREAIRAQQQELADLEVSRRKEEEAEAQRRKEEEARQLELHLLELQARQAAKKEEEERRKKEEEDHRKQQQLILGKGRKKMSFSLGFKMSQAERWTAEQPAGSKRVLRVPLGSPDDLPHARSAIHFIYSDELDVSSAADVLRVRRVASYLGVEGCTEACDAALLALVRKASAQPLEGLAEVYVCRKLLPDPRGEDPTAAALLDSIRTAGQELLVAYKGTAAEITATGGSKVQLGELLTWAFQDAPGVLNDPATRGRARSLPLSCLEALLSCDAFATDDEASVLVLLAEWLGTNQGTAEDVRKRLCGCIRVCHLNSGYLTGVLPLLSWFPLTRVEHTLLCQSMAVPSGPFRDQFVKQATGADYKWPACWTSGAARPQGNSSVGRVHEWRIAQGNLAEKLRGQAENGGLAVVGAFNGTSGLIYKGFEFYPHLQLKQRQDEAGVFLYCRLPSCLKPSRVPTVVAVASPGNCRLTTWKWAEGSDGTVERKTAHGFTYREWKNCMRVGCGLGFPDALPLLPAPAAAATPGAAAPDPLARWAPYLHEGKISGSLQWLAA
ncbi:hypothetical protein HYH03_011620 [Edaphochlamys debaryana]|uniref:BACK domain-containing protein n=1 Tax=Edaphochlamys debaryana TaxID=47281 RepID=A0A835XTT5_9CHLO|nr:hypothetical protein HYH03_011620 [Edaphochlamys debaryana]|eukprot:KAG2489991.1 hypothetical protein HYH03_011620 [Edaphochlamys debaryana]